MPPKNKKKPSQKLTTDEKNYFKRLGNRIRMLREGHNLTHIQLSVRCDCCECAISRIERAVAAPGSVLLLKLSSALEVPIYVLVDV